RGQILVGQPALVDRRTLQPLVVDVDVTRVQAAKALDHDWIPRQRPCVVRGYSMLREEAHMDEHSTKRREFLKQVTALGSAGVVAGLRLRRAQAGDAQGRSPMETSYDAPGTLEPQVHD